MNFRIYQGKETQNSLVQTILLFDTDSEVHIMKNGQIFHWEGTNADRCKIYSTADHFNEGIYVCDGIVNPMLYKRFSSDITEKKKLEHLPETEELYPFVTVRKPRTCLDVDVEENLRLFYSNKNIVSK